MAATDPGLALSMDDVGLIAAFIGGLLSFASPCVLPIVPAYLSIITGLDTSDLAEPNTARMARTAVHTLAFIAGFTVVFVLLGLTASSVGQSLVRHQVTITRLSGLLLVSMSLFILGSLFLKLPWLYQEKRLHPDLSRWGPFAAPVAGAAFGFGWTPCIGPILTSVLAIAATSGRAGSGAILLAVYSAGLGVPFLLSGLAFGRMTGAMAWLKTRMGLITWVSAASLGFFGVLLTFNKLIWLTTQLQSGLSAVGLDLLVQLG